MIHIYPMCSSHEHLKKKNPSKSNIQKDKFIISPLNFVFLTNHLGEWCQKPTSDPQNFFFLIYLAATLDLSCGTQDFRSLLQHMGSLIVAFELLVEACEI